jgi:hypothetical protein
VFRAGKRLDDMELRMSTLALAIAELRRDLAASAPAHLQELVKVLEDDLNTMRVSLRSLHGKVAYERRGRETNGGGRVDDSTSDEEFDRMIALQRGYGGTN